MSNIKLDLKEFKHVSSDDGSTTLQHPLGHMITLAHKSLSKDNQAQLAALAKLAKPEEVPPVSQPKAKKDREDIEKTMKAEGGKVEEPSVWDTVKKTVSDSMTDEPQKNNHPAPVDRQKARDMSRVFKAEGGEIDKTLAGEGDTPAEPNMSEAKPQAPVNININSGPQPQAQPSPNPVPAPAPQAPDTSPQMESPAPVQNMSMPQDPSANQQVPEAQVANPPEPKPIQPQHQVPAQAEMPEEEVDAQQSGEGSAPTPEQHKEAVQNELNTELQAWQQDLANGHIHPKTMHDLLWKDENGKDKGLLGKIGTIFGLLASGAGSGLTGQPNVLLSTLQKQIDNDVAAQEKSKENAQNLLRINQQQMMNEVEKKYKGQLGQLTEAQIQGIHTDIRIKSIALTRTMQNIGALNEMANTIKALPPGSPQRVQMEQTMGILYPIMTAENSDILAKAAAASALANFTGNPGGSDEQNFQQKNKALRMGGMEGLAKDNENKHFPGVIGQSSSDLSGSEKESINSGIMFDKQLRSFINWTKKHSGDLRPSDEKEGRALAAELQGAYRQATHGGVFKEGEQNFISKLIDEDPTKFFNKIRVLPSLNALKDTSNAKLNTLTKNLGFKGYNADAANDSKKESQYDGMKPKEGAESKSKSGKPMIFKDGKWSYK